MGIKKQKKRDYRAEYLRRKGRGFHSSEKKQYPKRRGKFAVGKTAYFPAKKGKLEKKKEAWAVYSYFTGIIREQENESEIIGITSYDITKTQLRNWAGSDGQDALFAMHGFMEREFAKYFSMVEGTDFNYAVKEDFNYEEDNDSQKKRKHRGFKWQLTDFITGDIRHQIHYEKGQIIKRDMWEGFDFVQFKLEIREQKIWE